MKRLFDKKNLDEITQEDMKNNIDSLQQIYDHATELNRKNSLLKAKYDNDVKYARMHKRIKEDCDILKSENEICEILMDIKNQVDDKVLINNQMLSNESYFGSLMMPMIIRSFDKTKVDLDPDTAKYINSCLAKEYMSEYQGIQRW